MKKDPSTILKSPIYSMYLFTELNSTHSWRQWGLITEIYSKISHTTSKRYKEINWIISCIFFSALQWKISLLHTFYRFHLRMQSSVLIKCCAQAIELFVLFFDCPCSCKETHQQRWNVQDNDKFKRPFLSTFLWITLFTYRFRSKIQETHQSLSIIMLQWYFIKHMDYWAAYSYFFTASLLLLTQLAFHTCLS